MSGHFFRNFFRMVSLVLLLMVVAMLSAIITMHFAIHGAEVQVPALKGMTVDQARSQAAGMGLNLVVDNRYYSADVSAGHILTQSPAPGTVVRREWRVRVSESLGPQKVDVPNVVGRDERVAAMQLRRVGLEVGMTAHLPDAALPEGTVIAQDPAAHAQGIEGPSVHLLLAAPDAEAADGYVMPNLVRLPVVTAQTQLAAVGLKFAIPTFESVPTAPAGAADTPAAPAVPLGSVIAQQPPAGARVDQAMEVHLTVAK